MKYKWLLIATGALTFAGAHDLSVSSTASANSVNDYILSKNWSKTNSNKQIREWLNHRSDADMNYRYGRPEGVVVHETANSSDKTNSNAIWDEIDYMLRNFGNGFVHSFVDEKQQVEIADPNYLSWGVGPVGNARFIQTEQVQVNSKDAFAHELFNLAVLQAGYLKQYNLTPSLGGTVWSHAMVTEKLGGTDHSDPNGYWADMAARYFGTVYTMNDYEYLIEKVYNSLYTSKYKVGDTVQITGIAETEENGYSIVNRRNWIGTIQKVVPTNASYSHFKYYVKFPNGEWNEQVLEQDLQAPTGNKYKVGQTVQITSNATNEYNGWNLKDHQNWIGTVKSMKPTTVNGGWIYHVAYPNGDRNEEVIENDLKVASGPKFGNGANVQVTSVATNESTGWNLQNRRNWVGTVKSSKVNNQSKSHYEYWITYPDGQRSEHVLEQDLQVAPSSKYKVGDRVKISAVAESETNGYSIKGRRNWEGTVKRVTMMNHASSRYAYWVQYDNGEWNELVPEQDLLAGSVAKYKVGQSIQITSVATNEYNGWDLRNHQNWIGTVKSVKSIAGAGSKFAYWITYPNGERNEEVLEQDIRVADLAKYKVGQRVKISSAAESETNGYSLVNRRNWIGTVKKVSTVNHASSRYSYWVAYDNGEWNELVPEQDVVLP